MRLVSLYFEFLRLNVRASLEYRADFLIGVLSTVLMQGGQLLALGLVMRQVPALRGWSLDEVLLMFGLITAARSLNHMFGDNLWRLGWLYVRTGDFDRFLLRPINPLFHFIADRFCQDGVGYLLVALALIVKASLGLHLLWTPLTLLCAAGAVLGGGLIFFGVNLITACSAFWITESLPVTLGAFMTHEFAQYPLNLYGRGVTLVLTFVLPYGLISFYPVRAIARGEFGVLAWAAPLAGLMLTAIGTWVWGRGLRRYGSSGS